MVLEFFSNSSVIFWLCFPNRIFNSPKAFDSQPNMLGSGDIFSEVVVWVSAVAFLDSSFSDDVLVDLLLFSSYSGMNWSSSIPRSWDIRFSGAEVLPDMHVCPGVGMRFWIPIVRWSELTIKHPHDSYPVETLIPLRMQWGPFLAEMVLPSGDQNWSRLGVTKSWEGGLPWIGPPTTKAVFGHGTRLVSLSMVTESEGRHWLHWKSGWEGCSKDV